MVNQPNQKLIKLKRFQFKNAKFEKKRILENWLLGLETHFSDRILGIDRYVAQIWGELTANTKSKGIIVPGMDGLIAATALHHGLHVMTGNVRHFHSTGAMLIDPWSN